MYWIASRGEGWAGRRGTSEGRRQRCESRDGSPGALFVIGGLVLAAGRGSRFGSAKQLADLDGRPLLEHAIEAMTSSDVDRVVVVLGAGADDVAPPGVDLHGAEPVVCGPLGGGPVGVARLRARGAPPAARRSWSPSATSRASRPTRSASCRHLVEERRRRRPGHVTTAIQVIPFCSSASCSSRVRNVSGDKGRAQPTPQRSGARRALRRPRRRRGRGHPGSARRPTRGRAGGVKLDH